MKKLLITILIIILFIASTFLGYIYSSNKNLDSSNPKEYKEKINDSNKTSLDKITLDRAKNLVDTMTLEEKVGQMFFARCRKDTAISDLTNYNLGGFILFDANIRDESKSSLISTITSYQDASKLPMFIAVDEEGGTVNRLSKYIAFRGVPFKSPRDLYEIGGFQTIRDDTKEKAELLLSLGINVNLAPVADVSTDSSDYIHNRTFGDNAKEVSEYVSLVVKTMKENNIGSSLKHFPGYGNNQDTHTGFSIDERSYESFKNSDFLPFKAGIKSGADSILVSHNIIKAIDEDLPASLSPKVNKIIRQDLGFNGVLITDDLQMDAIKEYIGDYTSAILAIKAGNDLLIASDFDIQIPSVLDSIENGELSEKRINESVLRILYWKINLELI
ncbi:glycoside hydrolase family 3 N-terminal domain-containing protein [Clostridium sp.]|uniref:glycoside hydrolase family 3 protein n=1 Tax=Clostridium sp. TaxID=1506 RepID=UPI0026190CCD|nr:glycoside hydrolase family 3 N-terminal domain-containing protein [Clostridium sp.]